MLAVFIYSERIDSHGISHMHKPFEVWFVSSHRASKCYNATSASLKRLNTVIGNQWRYEHCWTNPDGSQVWSKAFRS